MTTEARFGAAARKEGEMTDAVPIIDLSPYFEGTQPGKRQVAHQVGRACRELGFLTVTGHGVPVELIERVYGDAKAFFDLPVAVKAAIRQPSPDTVRGYSGVGEEGLSYSLDEASPGDLKESLTVGQLAVPDDPYFFHPDAGRFFAPNLWPAQPAGLEASWSAYFRAMESLSQSLMRIFALALDLPETYFDPTIDKHISNFRAINYPDQPDTPLAGQLRAGAHSDYGSLTIVRQEEAPGGLQVQNEEGRWLDVKPVPGAFVVNIGDLMMQWTNDQWRSTMHRVVNPPRDKALGSRRISLVFFHQPNYDALVSCLPSCQGVGNPPRYAPITSGRHFIGKFVKQSTMTVDAA
jgi:isopenicillin N synthase-like dioxygenase